MIARLQSTSCMSRSKKDLQSQSALNPQMLVSLFDWVSNNNHNNTIMCLAN